MRQESQVQQALRQRSRQVANFHSVDFQKAARIRLAHYTLQEAV
jgi:hypothetical protein